MIEKFGRWISDTEFEFFEARELGPGLVMKSLDVGQFIAADPTITPEMVIEALVTGRVVDEPEPGADSDSE